MIDQQLNPWLTNNLKSWIDTFEVTANLLDYEVGYMIWNYDTMLDHITNTQIDENGSAWCISLYKNNKEVIIMILYFINGTPIRVQLAASVEERADINKLEDFKKIMEDHLI